MGNEFGLSKELLNVVKFLRSSKDIKLFEAVMADRRVEAFKGNTNTDYENYMSFRFTS